ncbi:MAG: hypothetical protein HKN33_03720 [Pyrinomonadaceae bacterium]|nr:hypothetical protein [Pyrinomonadaceae bacterium]
MEEVALRNFEDGLVQHCKEFAPKHSEVIEDEGVRKVVKLGIKRANEYGFTKRGPIRFYVELMFMFGSDFDNDFQLPWAEGVLTNDQISDEMERADALHEKMLEYLEQVAGEDDEYSLKALRKLSKARLEKYRVAGGTIEDLITMALRDVYPQKYEYLGEDRIETLVEGAKQAAKRHSVSSETGLVLFASLIFAIGHGFDNDPLFPWVKATMKDDSVPDPNERAEKLEKKMKIYLERALEYLEELKK